MNSISNPLEAPRPTDTASRDLDGMLTEALKLTFPASDPIAVHIEDVEPKQEPVRGSDKQQQQHEASRTSDLWESRPWCERDTPDADMQ